MSIMMFCLSKGQVVQMVEEFKNVQCSGVKEQFVFFNMK